MASLLAGVIETPSKSVLGCGGDSATARQFFGALPCPRYLLLPRICGLPPDFIFIVDGIIAVWQTTFFAVVQFLRTPKSTSKSLLAPRAFFSMLCESADIAEITPAASAFL